MWNCDPRLLSTSRTRKHPFQFVQGEEVVDDLAVTSVDSHSTFLSSLACTRSLIWSMHEVYVTLRVWTRRVFDMASSRSHSNSEQKDNHQGIMQRFSPYHLSAVSGNRRGRQKTKVAIAPYSAIIHLLRSPLNKLERVLSRSRSGQQAWGRSSTSSNGTARDQNPTLKRRSWI